MARQGGTDVDGTESHDVVSLLSSPERKYLIRNDCTQVPVDSLKGKKVGLYFSASWCGPCHRFTPILAEAYEQFSPKGDVEIVFLSADKDEDSFQGYFSKMPWLAVPFSDSASRDSLDDLFKVRGIPYLVILDECGRVVTESGVEMIREYGVEGYPFTEARIRELKEIEKAREESQTLVSVLVKGDRDFLVGHGGKKIPVSDLVGKNVLLYFSAHWCPPCRAFMPKLIEAYNKIKSKDNAFEVVFISSDKDEAAFEKFYAEMPWLALPFGDERKEFLSRKFKVRGIPLLVALGPTGRTLTKDARNLVTVHGADAYPFTEDHIKKKEEELEELAKGWPKTLRHPLHEEHELALTRRMMFKCDGCQEDGQVWSYYCEECDFDLHPKCGLKDEAKEEKTEKDEGKEGWVCDGDVCHKA